MDGGVLWDCRATKSERQQTQGPGRGPGPFFAVMSARVSFAKSSPDRLMLEKNIRCPIVRTLLLSRALCGGKCRDFPRKPAWPVIGMYPPITAVSLTQDLDKNYMPPAL